MNVKHSLGSRGWSFTDANDTMKALDSVAPRLEIIPPRLSIITPLWHVRHFVFHEKEGHTDCKDWYGGNTAPQPEITFLLPARRASGRLFCNVNNNLHVNLGNSAKCYEWKIIELAIYSLIRGIYSKHRANRRAAYRLHNSKLWKSDLPRYCALSCSNLSKANFDRCSIVCSTRRERDLSYVCALFSRKLSSLNLLTLKMIERMMMRQRHTFLTRNSKSGFWKLNFISCAWINIMEHLI